MHFTERWTWFIFIHYVHMQLKNCESNIFLFDTLQWNAINKKLYSKSRVPLFFMITGTYTIYFIYNCNHLICIKFTFVIVIFFYESQPSIYGHISFWKIPQQKSLHHESCTCTVKQIYFKLTVKSCHACL